MIFVVGGAFQGKGEAAASLAAETFGKPRGILRADAGEIRFDRLETRTFDILEHVHLLVRKELCRRMMQGDAAALDGSQKAAMEAEVYQVVWKGLDGMIRRNDAVILTMDELGCGVVPMTYGDRAYREIAGRIGCALAAEAKEVYRVTCGVAKKIK